MYFMISVHHNLMFTDHFTSLLYVFMQANGSMHIMMDV